MHVGHSEQTCMVQNPDLAPREEKQTAQWIPKKQDPSKDLGTSLPVANTQSNDSLATSKDKEVAVSDSTPSAANGTTIMINNIVVNASSLIAPVDSDENCKPLFAQETGFNAQQIAVYGIPTQNRIVISTGISKSQTNVDNIETPLCAPEATHHAQTVGNNPVEQEATPNLAVTPGLVVEAANSCTMGDKVDLENPYVVTTENPLETPTGIYARQKTPLLRHSTSLIGLNKSYKENAPCVESCLNLGNESDPEEDYDTEVYEEIIVINQTGLLRLQLQPITPVATNQGNAQSLAVPSELKSVIFPVPSALSPTATPSEDEVLALTSLSAPAIVDSTTELQDAPPFQQSKNRGCKKKTQENTLQSSLAIVSTASAFAILSED